MDGTAQLDNIQVAVDCVNEANQIAFDFLGNIDNKTEKDGFVIHTHLNLIGRIFEHVGGMLTCVATQCPTSSEALWRVVVEGSVNLMHMSEFGREEAIVAFFESWIDGHERKLDEWLDSIKDKEHSGSVRAQIDERKKLVSFYKNYVAGFIDKFAVDRKNYTSVWPKSLFKRFKNVDCEEFYYAHYHRLSGASHITAEDTISWLIALNLDFDQQQKIANEAVSYSIMMSRLSSVFFIDALAICCIEHGLSSKSKLNRLKELKEQITTSVFEIAKSAGVPR